MMPTILYDFLQDNDVDKLRTALQKDEYNELIGGLDNLMLSSCACRNNICEMLTLVLIYADRDQYKYIKDLIDNSSLQEEYSDFLSSHKRQCFIHEEFEKRFSVCSDKNACIKQHTRIMQDITMERISKLIMKYKLLYNEYYETQTSLESGDMDPVVQEEYAHYLSCVLHTKLTNFESDMESHLNGILDNNTTITKGLLYQKITNADIQLYPPLDNVRKFLLSYIDSKDQEIGTNISCANTDNLYVGDITLN